MGKFLSFDDLPGLIPDYKQVGQAGIAVGQMISEAMQNRAQRRSQEQRAAAQLEHDKAVAAQRAAHETAVLGETSRHNQAGEADAVADRAAQIRAAQAAQITGGQKALLESGGNPEVARLQEEALNTLRGGESATSAPGGTSYPGQLSRFPGAEIGHFMPRTSALLGDTGQSVQGGAQPGADDTQSQAGAPAPVGGDVGTFNADAMRKASVAQSGSLQGISEMPATLPIVRKRRAAAVKALEGVPFANPADRVKAIEEMSTNAERNETSIVNAARQAEATGARSGASQGRLDNLAVERLYRNNLNSAINQDQLTKINARIRDTARVDTLIEDGGGINPTNDPNALMQRALVRGLLKANSPGAQSNYELQEWMQSGGKPAQLETAWNVWANGGELSPTLIGLMKSLAQTENEIARQERANLAEKASNSVFTSPTLRRQVGHDEKMMEALRLHAQDEILGGGSVTEVGGGQGGGDGGGAGASQSTSRGGILAIDSLGEPLDPSRFITGEDEP